jgi:RimJ/RimL family protein N-acetyltransferase
MMSEPHLLTDRLFFRPFRETDQDDLAALDGDPEVMRFLGDGRPHDRDQARERLDHLIGHWRQHGFGVWALFARGGGFVGRCGVAYRHHPSAAELAYALTRASWGKGLATEAVRMALQHAFAVVRLPRVVAFARADNLASRRILEKVGMTLVGPHSYGGFAAVLYQIENPSAAARRQEDGGGSK